ncbi:MAG: hypothetical protein FWB84_03665 [Candidatus Bathyarchaeota archaeon]|uniref:hypothetical protein n=1 Tax=Candidatus Bathycorpusculum sp. TaxID=2994959 RepID=UPI0028199365|nr:hypothetical protein [Candidatus Termiticorpusculum sp.]
MFEKGEKFEGQTLSIDGKKIVNGFLIDLAAIYWVSNDENDADKEKKSSVGDNIKKALIAYIVALGLMQGFNFLAGNIFSSIAENKAPNYDTLFYDTELTNNEAHKF